MSVRKRKIEITEKEYGLLADSLLLNIRANGIIVNGQYDDKRKAVAAHKITACQELRLKLADGILK